MHPSEVHSADGTELRYFSNIGAWNEVVVLALYQMVPLIEVFIQTCKTKANPFDTFLFYKIEEKKLLHAE